MRNVVYFIAAETTGYGQYTQTFLMEVHGHHFGNMSIYQVTELGQEEDGLIYQLIFQQIIQLHLIILMHKDHMIW